MEAFSYVDHEIVIPCQMPPWTDFFLNDARIEPRRLCIVIGHETRTVEPLAMRILMALVDAGGQVITREELIDAVWPDGYAGEGSLSRAIWSLRQALGDNARSPEYIETVPRVGYRLMATVHHPDRPAVEGSKGRMDHLERLNARLRRTVAVLAIALVAVSTGWGIHAASDAPSYEQFLKIKRPDGTIDSLHMQSETPIAFSSTLLDAYPGP